MMQKSYLLLLVIVSFLLITPGCAVKKMIKKAEQFEAAGMYGDATDLYYQAFLKKPQKVEIKIALQRAGQIYIEDLAENVAQAHNKGDYKTCIDNYLIARDLVSKLKPQGVTLNIDHGMVQQFEDAKVSYLAKRYALGQKEIGEQNYDKARGIFQEVFRIDPDYKEVKSYLNQATYEPLYQEGSGLFDEGDFMEAYRKWNSIFTRDKNYKDVDIRMQQALDERYKEGALLLMDENFDGAAVALGEVHNANRNYKDVNTLYTEARNEPIYRRANKLMEDGKCRTAFYDFSNIVNDAGEYKNAMVLKEDALSCAQYAIAIQTPTIKNHQSAAGRFESMLSNKILDFKSPFVKVYDLLAIDNRANQSLGSSSGSIDRALLSQLATRNNIKAVLLIDFTTYIPNEGKKISDNKTGFERLVVKATTSGENSFYDKKIKYTEYSQKKEVSVTISYKLIDTSNGEVLLSDRLSKHEQDEINYAEYDGSTENIYPSTNNNGVYSINEANYKHLQNLFKASRDIKSTGQLTDDIFKSITESVARKINNFDPEK